MCTNRLVQHGLQVRLQLFKTQNKGWGIRCLDDIAKGSFVCIYAGKILTDDFADKEGLEMGDEYFANLDHIESVENFKEGYESDAKCSSDGSGVDVKGGARGGALRLGRPGGRGQGGPAQRRDRENEDNSDRSDSDSDDEDEEEEEDDDDDEEEEEEEESSDDNFCKEEFFNASSVWRSYATRRQTRGMKEGGAVVAAAAPGGDSKEGLSRQQSLEDSQPPVSEETGKNKVASWLSGIKQEQNKPVKKEPQQDKLSKRRASDAAQPRASDAAQPRASDAAQPRASDAGKRRGQATRPATGKRRGPGTGKRRGRDGGAAALQQGCTDIQL
ncbi:Histone-lysine N-methyltransferase SETDB1 [Acipenser ruthenus]|uniref:Histone-lysine N-methyltransferase SETDB1 n=1 Tax=Acipenser ruthenus TaxID=7906 RepID=A0A444UFB6_ACIRT|nr:Histone-lysine N-methyltransferase SETDB1 [Acipenser ruthenus]